MIWIEIGWLSLLAPIGSYIILKLQAKLNNYLQTISIEKKQIGDTRGQKIQEVIQGIKLIKFNGWEQIIID
jgi:hypothetical protein